MRRLAVELQGQPLDAVGQQGDVGEVAVDGAHLDLVEEVVAT